MARSRNIMLSFFLNDELIELCLAARLLFIRLWTLADREGYKAVKAEYMCGARFVIPARIASSLDIDAIHAPKTREQKLCRQAFAAYAIAQIRGQMGSPANHKNNNKVGDKINNKISDKTSNMISHKTSDEMICPKSSQLGRSIFAQECF